MATEYKITYTYTGQGNTSAKRNVAISRFKKSGDVDRKIAQITSVTYVHYHTSTKPMTWNLRGRLVFADGTTITSPNIGHKISGDVVKYTHTFTTLPTAEQWAMLSSVQTLDSNGSTGDSGYSADLYWRANSSYPMKIIVTFIEEPPVVYDPKIKNFSVTRCDADGHADDEGTHASVSLQIGIADANGLANASLRIYYERNAVPDVDTSAYIDLTSRISEMLTGVTNNLEILEGEWDAGYSWMFAAVFIAGEEFDAETETMPHALCSLHVAANHGGVCVCGFANGTDENPMFESHAPAYFYEGIHGVTNYAAAETKTGGTWLDGKKVYRRVFKFSNVAIGSGTSMTTLGVLDNFADIETMIEIRGTLHQGVEFFPLPRYWSDSSGTYSLDVNNGNIRLRSIGGSSPVDVVVELLYTKTTEEVS